MQRCTPGIPKCHSRTETDPERLNGLLSRTEQIIINKQMNKKKPTLIPNAHSEDYVLHTIFVVRAFCLEFLHFGECVWRSMAKII